ncbi:MAG: hypothetical protein DGJ47_000960, partial [Rickettsiaceae bacterium]
AKALANLLGANESLNISCDFNLSILEVIGDSDSE